MRLWGKIRRFLAADRGRCWNCGLTLGQAPATVRRRVHDRCLDQYDNRMAW